VRDSVPYRSWNGNEKLLARETGRVREVEEFGQQAEKLSLNPPRN